MRILKIDHQALKTKCLPITEFNELVKIRLDIMWQAMEKEKGMGLSANQIGFFNRMFVMKGEDGNRYNILNPEILMKSEDLFRVSESCLSLPGILINTKVRSREIVVKFQDETGKEHNGVFTDYDAICFQHEMDHLDGKDFLSYLNRDSRRTIQRKYL